MEGKGLGTCMFLERDRGLELDWASAVWGRETGFDGQELTGGVAQGVAVLEGFVDRCSRRERRDTLSIALHPPTARQEAHPSPLCPPSPPPPDSPPPLSSYPTRGASPNGFPIKSAHMP